VRIARSRLVDEVSEQIGMPQVETVEHTDDHEPWPMLGSQLIHAMDDLHRR
jgi:hypothetical protein